MEEKKYMEIETTEIVDEMEVVINEPLAGQISLFDLLEELRWWWKKKPYDSAEVHYHMALSVIL